MKRVLLISFVLVLGVLDIAIAGRGGPDEFGYTYIDSDEPGGPVFNWIEINSIGTPLGMHGADDDAYRTVGLPETFNFYGVDYTSVNICSNGWVNFGVPYGGARYIFNPFPDPTDPNALLCIFGTDLLPRTSPGDVYYYYDRTGRKFIVEFDGIIEYSSGTIPFVFEVVLDFLRETILFQYLVTGPLISHTAQIGIENETGTIGLYYGTHDRLHNNLAILFSARAMANVPYYTDFETEPGREGFETTDSTVWEVGTPSRVGPSAAHSGSICWGTNIRDNYPNSADAMLLTLILNTPGLSHPILDFWHWYSTEPNVDGGNIKISTDEGASWEILVPMGGYPVRELEGVNALYGQPAFSGNSGGWEKVYIDLSEYTARQCRVAFHFASDARGGSYPGWYIDDLGFYEAFGVLRGHITLSYATNNSGAIIRIPELGLADTTDESGSFYLDSVRIGSYRVEVSRVRFVPFSRDSVPITFLDTTSLDITLYPELYYANFELDSGDLVPNPSTGAWQWGEVDTAIPPYTAVSGTHLWGTNLHGRYENNANWKLDLYTVLTTVAHPGLQVWMWYSFDGEYEGLLFDGGNVKISADNGATFEIITPTGGYDGVVSPHNVYLGNQPAFGGLHHGDSWHLETFDLTPYAGLPVIIRFEIGTDNVGTSWGWYIDDIRITEYSGVNYNEIRPAEFSLSTYPNPFNSVLTISINANLSAVARLLILNATGERVFENANLLLKNGENRIEWNGIDMHGGQAPAGLYLVRVTFNNQVFTKRVVLLK